LPGQFPLKTTQTPNLIHAPRYRKKENATKQNRERYRQLPLPWPQKRLVWPFEGDFVAKPNLKERKKEKKQKNTQIKTKPLKIQKI
jgi:hypothetical protein